jgi:hypothetical protein
LTVFGLLQPTIFGGFASVTLMAACLEETICYRYWSQLGVELSQHPAIKPGTSLQPSLSSQCSFGGLIESRP